LRLFGTLIAAASSSNQDQWHGSPVASLPVANPICRRNSRLVFQQDIPASWGISQVKKKLGRFLSWGDRFQIRSCRQPFKEKEEFTSVVYSGDRDCCTKTLNFAKDFKADPCGTIRLKAEWPTFHFYSTVTVNGVKRLT